MDRHRINAGSGADIARRAPWPWQLTELGISLLLVGFVLLLFMLAAAADQLDDDTARTAQQQAQALRTCTAQLAKAGTP